MSSTSILRLNSHLLIKKTSNSSRNIVLARKVEISISKKIGTTTNPLLSPQNFFSFAKLKVNRINLGVSKMLRSSAVTS